MTPPDTTAVSRQNAIWLYDWCKLIASLDLPYRKGGGHGVGPVKGPHGMWLPPTRGDEPGEPVGYDCSGATCSAAWRAGILGKQEATNTEGLESWGIGGMGTWATLRVLDLEGVIHHCFWQFTNLGAERPDRLWTAQIPGTDVGYFTASSNWVSGFHARHSPGT